MAYDVRVERLRWLLLAATGGGIVACAGKSIDEGSDDGRGGETSAGGLAGKSGAGSPGRAGTNSGGSKAGSGGVPLPGTGGSVTPGAGGTTGRAGASGGGSAGEGGESAGGSGGYGGQPPPVRSCDPVGSYGPGTTRCEGDFVHREALAMCPLPQRTGAEGGAPSDGGTGGAEHGGAANTGGDDCQSDLDCTAKPNGYCLQGEEYQNGGYKYCFYACELDSDCESGEVCACSVESLGRCVAADCKTDAECGDGLLCISPLDVNGCDGAIPTGFHCQSSADECAGHDECDDGYGCEYLEGKFQCQGLLICGRPFLVDGQPRVASVGAGSSWNEGVAGFVASEPLSNESARRIARHWLDNALMEHASIAAFARFSLELLALAAPASLVEESTRAMADEIRHAKLCFSLARRYDAEDVAPGPLDMTGALGTVELLDVVERAILEGCIGETTAALEAGWAADAATDPVVREVLQAIAEDEARHAALAFRFVAWAAQRDERVGALIERHARAASGEGTRGNAGDASVRERAELARHGVLDGATREAARRTALREVVGPALFELMKKDERFERDAKPRAMQHECIMHASCNLNASYEQ
jgi:hypothetical protein